MDKDLKSKTVAELEEIALTMGQKRFVAKTIFSFIHQHGAVTLDQFTTASKAFRQELSSQGYYISQLKVVDVFKDPDGTVKYLFELGDSTRIETVELTNEEDRKTLCISTQVGCRMGCAFCATAKLHFTRNLTAGEIVDQVLQVEKLSNARIGNVVYMGMGEPMDNYAEVMKSVRILNDPAGKNIGARHITISTSGIVDGIVKLGTENLQVRLAVSLHAATDSVRDQIMGINRKYPIAVVLEAMRDYQARTGRRITIEYVLIKDLNDRTIDARALVRLLEGIKVNVNLIEYNPHPGCDFAPSDRRAIYAFAQTLTDMKIEMQIRYKRGQSINAACGQLGANFLNP